MAITPDLSGNTPITTDPTLADSQIQAFIPVYNTGVIVAPGLTSALQAIGTVTKSLRLTNLSAVLIYVRVGVPTADGTLTASTADLPLLANTQVTLTKQPEHTHIAFISPGGASSMHIISGEGFQ